MCRNCSVKAVWLGSFGYIEISRGGGVGTDDAMSRQVMAALERFIQRRYFCRRKFPTNIASMPDE
jgi:hypothetical protein